MFVCSNEHWRKTYFCMSEKQGELKCPEDSLLSRSRLAETNCSEMIASYLCPQGEKGDRGERGLGYEASENFPTGFIQGPPGPPGQPGRPGKKVRVVGWPQPGLPTLAEVECITCCSWTVFYMCEMFYNCEIFYVVCCCFLKCIWVRSFTQGYR